MTTNDVSNFLFPFTTETLSSLNIDASRLSKSQLIWLSGYYWGKAQYIQEDALSNQNVSNTDSFIVSIVSASQTGNAHKLSALFFDKLQSNNIKSRLIQACDYSFKSIVREKFLILIVSTQGEGEPPEEAISFYNFLMSKKISKLNNFHYAVFGLGDSSYNLFCKAGKDFDNRFCELGGIRLIDRIDADVEYSSIATRWFDKLIEILKIKFKEKIFENNKNTKVVQKAQTVINKITKDNPFPGIFLVNQKITGRDSIKDVRHIEIGIDSSKVKYFPGDALGVWYKNDSKLILDILSIFNINRNELVCINKKKVSIFTALEQCFELTSNTNNVVCNYAALTNDNNFKKLVLDKQETSMYVKNNPILSMFSEFPVILTAVQLIKLLRPLTPRFYSISSSQNVLQDEIHITVGVVQYFLSNRLYQGGASSYLSYRVEEDSSVPVFIQSNKHFRLPDDNSASIIMIGPGTGIAPFRSFMQERNYLKSTGKNWIFYGNLTFTEDFLYQREWQKYFDSGLLTNIDLAWSRDSKKKVYVQHKLWDRGEEIWDWIVRGAYIYICGDKLNMAKDVEITLLKIFSEYGHMDTEQSCEYLNNLRMNRRYQRDIY